MKLSNETLSVLKNFSTINKNLQFKKGNQLSTISETKTVLANATLKDSFPEDFCVYDLNQFLSVLALHKDTAELEFVEHSILFKNGRRKTNFRKTDPSNIIAPPTDKKMQLSNTDVSFVLSANDFNDIMKSASVLSSPNISVKSDGTNTFIVACDAKDSSQNFDEIQLENVECPDKEFNVVFKTDNMKMIPGQYNVDISFKGFARFTGSNGDIEYWVAIESKDSTF